MAAGRRRRPLPRSLQTAGALGCPVQLVDRARVGEGRRPNQKGSGGPRNLGGFFIFIFFLFSFLTKIYFLFGSLHEYTPGRPAAGRPGPGRPAAGRQGLLCKYFCGKNCAEVPGAGRPAAGRPALAARLLGDRLSHPYIWVGWSPRPSFASQKFHKPRKFFYALQIDYVVIIFVETVY